MFTGCIGSRHRWAINPGGAPSRWRPFRVKAPNMQGVHDGGGMTGRPGRAHHQGGYGRYAAAVRKAAYANPATRCWKCGHLINEVAHKNGRPARWTAGHVIDGQVNGELRAECSVCAATTGAVRGNKLRNPRSEDPYQ